MTGTHDFIEKALRSELRLLSQCTPEHQPSGDLLTSLQNLLTLHRKGTPAEDFETRLEAIKAKVDNLGFSAAVTGRRR